jgi:N-acetylglucosamine-6-phosphate deacetylase
MRLGVHKCLVDGRLIEGDVVVDDGTISAVGVSPPGKTGTAVPGFVDVQVNGFAGADFAGCDVDGYRAAGTALAATGVTAYQPTYICLPPDAYAPALQVAAAAQRLAGLPRLIGVHLEGPFLSPERIGAHDPANTALPDTDWARWAVTAGPVTYTTIAPELTGALDLIRFFADAGITVALGHSDADAATADAGFDAGARAVTHLFNAQRPWRHRDPGISGAALVRDAVTLTLILDGNHLAPETVTMIRRTAPGRIALITDAIAAAGQPPGTTMLGDREVTVQDGVARLPDGTLAGSVLTMDRAVREFIELGATPEEAIGAASEVPARLLSRPDLGVLQPGNPADLVVLDESMQVSRTMVGGEVVHAA